MTKPLFVGACIEKTQGLPLSSQPVTVRNKVATRLADARVMPGKASSDSRRRSATERINRLMVIAGGDDRAAALRDHAGLRGRMRSGLVIDRRSINRSRLPRARDNGAEGPVTANGNSACNVYPDTSRCPNQAARNAGSAGSTLLETGVARETRNLTTSR